PLLSIAIEITRMSNSQIAMIMCNKMENEGVFYEIASQECLLAMTRSTNMVIASNEIAKQYIE
ncbi:hypothetical protein LLG34_00485, partial [bacterium]|nr:hypothetical protein [bacterium]